jgi:hypothetical protein
MKDEIRPSEENCISQSKRSAQTNNRDGELTERLGSKTISLLRENENNYQISIKNLISDGHSYIPRSAINKLLASRLRITKVETGLIIDHLVRRRLLRHSCGHGIILCERVEDNDR